ncbi:hypothetical protein ZWY2020_022886 [Hordeum vulgare]|nr:hypothetical protein ZWY2020_022886 [Hordeum vulgare]
MDNKQLALNRKYNNNYLLLPLGHISNMELVTSGGGRNIEEACTHHDVLESTQQGMTMQEAVAFAKLKAFSSCIVKNLAPLLLKEVQASVMRPDADPYTPRRTTRAAKRTAGLGVTNATPAENVLLRTLGLAVEDLEVDDQDVEKLMGLFDSPLREQHIKVIAALFGKAMPTGGELARKDAMLVGA